jgi:hypothetical protein
MGDTAVSGIELAVGIACAILALGAWRGGLRIVAVAALVAAAAAVGHAVWALVT